MRRSARFWFALFLAACGGGNEQSCDVPTASHEPQECAALSGATWLIIVGAPEVVVEVEGSRRVLLDPYVEAQCSPTVRSVEWSVDDTSVAAVVPMQPIYRGCWVSGLRTGTSAVGARIVFSDGTAQRPEPRTVQVVTPELPAGSSLVAEGTLDFEPFLRKYIPFAVPAESKELVVRVNWRSPLNRLEFSLFEGECAGDSAAPCQAGLRYIGAPPFNLYEEPLTWSYGYPAAGFHTVVIDNLGPGAETARYEMWITPG
jgi:hypothetical protein